MLSSLFKFISGGGSRRKDKVQSPFASAPVKENEFQTAPQMGCELQRQELQETQEVEEASLSSSAEVISLPLALVIKQLPRELSGNVAAVGRVRGRVDLPRKKVVEQLKHGVVRVSFGEIRQIAPEGTFIKSGNHDNAQVELPLKPILEQLRVDDYPRRPNQHLVTVPQGVNDLFGPNGERLTDVRIISKTDIRPVADPSMSALGSTALLRKGVTLQSARNTGTTSDQAHPPVSKSAVDRPMAKPEMSKDKSRSEGEGVIAVSDVLKAALLQSGSPSSSGRALQPKTSGGSPLSKKLPPAQPPEVDGNSIQVPLAALSAGWPEPLLREIETLGLGTSSCQLVLEALKKDLMQGKVTYTWNQIRSWLNPLPADLEASPHADLELTLPLKVLAPVFIRSMGSPKENVTSTLQNVPDVFQGESPVSSLSRITPHASNLPSPRIHVAPKESGESSLQTKTKRIHKASKQTETRMAKDAESSLTSISKLRFPLKTVIDAWPEPLLNLIVEHQLESADLEVPLEILERDLKSGKLNYTWNQVCTWIVGFPEEVDLGEHADESVEFPLSVLAPLYFKHRSGFAAKKSYVPSDIPDLFSSEGSPIAPQSVTRAASSPIPSAPHASGLFPVQDESKSAASVPPTNQANPTTATETRHKSKRPPSNLSELFSEPKKKNWTPNEIVHRSSQLPGVAGALIALQDGLLVASCLPPGWKTETVSAFLPQIFGRMRQYTRELAIGELTSLTLYVEKGPLQIFNAGLIYFLVLGQAETPMPMQELNIIANELSRHTK